LIEAGRRVLRQEAEALASAAERLASDFIAACEAILACEGKIVCAGIGKSGHIARKAAATFSSTGTPSVFMSAAEALHGDLGLAASGDLALLYSASGETDEVVRIMPALRGQGLRLMVMTGRPESSAARLADVIIESGVESEACPNNLAPTTSTTLMLALSDALAVAVMEKRGFGREDFGRLHPAGSLGRRLTLRVRDVMRTGADLPMAAPSDSFLDVLRTITRAGAGGACVVEADGRLLGFISDGDVRRRLIADSGALEADAASLMSPGAAQTEPGLLAAEALEAFQNHPRKIGEMPVVEEGRVVGLLVLKDLLRSGIV
jgi:arabinose-5-phosphate isomerase